MKLSEVSDVLGKAKQILGDAVDDAEVILKDEAGTTTIIQRIEVAFADMGGDVANLLTLVHGAATVKLDPPADPTEVPAEGTSEPSTS